MASKGQELVWAHKSHHRPEYDALEGTKKYTGQWDLNYHDMTWMRPQFYYSRHGGGENTGKVCQNIQLARGPMVRPGPLRDVVHLDVPHAVLRSHPDTPGILPSELEGMWTDTNPAWPELSINTLLGGFGLQAAWEDCSAENTEIFDGEAYDVSGFDSLSAVIVYVRAASRPERHAA